MKGPSVLRDSSVLFFLIHLRRGRVLVKAICTHISVPLPPHPTPRYNATSSVFVCAYLFMLMKSLLRDLQRERLLTRYVAGV